MDKRVLLATTISMAVVLLWIAVFNPQKSKPKTPAPAQTQSQPATANPATAEKAKEATGQPATKPADKATADKAADKATADKATADKATADKATAANAAADKTAGPPAPPAARPKPVLTTWEQAKHYRATFTTEGGAAVDWVLLNPQYKQDNPKKSNKQTEPVDLVRTQPPNLPAVVTFPKSSFDVPTDAMYTAQPRGADGALVYTYDTDKVRVTKRYVQVPGTYQINYTVTIENKTGEPLPHYFQLQMHGWQDPAEKPAGFLARRVSQTTGLCDVGGKLKSENLEGLLKKPVDQLGQVRWTGIGDQYFVMAAALKPSDAQRRCNVFAAPDGSISSILTAEGRTVPAHGKTEYQMALFFGPKILSQLDAVRVAGVDPGMGAALDYGWKEVLTRPMLAVLKAINVVVPNWGWDIVVLTILLKALTWFPTQSSLKSMKAMAKLKPEMDKLKEKYGNDKQRLNVEMMNLYKQHGVNPLGGCLPMLIQFPIYIALYAMLGSAVELYRSPFFGWIRDLTAADPYYVLPIVAGVLMFAQQKTQPTSADPQQKMMMYIMPVMFTVFSIFLPAGLTLYILTSTVLTFAQQWLLNRGGGKSTPGKKMTTKPARA
jgi:YidC/Oxa1 family membrane protein insertase